MSIFLKTKRLILYTPALKDFDDLYALQRDAEVMKYIGKGIRTREEVAQGLEKALAHQQKYGFSMGSVYEKESGQFVGRAGLIYLAYDDTQPDIEVGYGLFKKFWDKGYATELTLALIEWAFAHLSIGKIVGIIHPQNERSRRVLEKVKMKYICRSTYNNQEVALYHCYKPNIDADKLKLVPATLDDYPTIQNMGRFYVYDMSEFLGDESGWEIPKDGLYECISLKKYWDDENSFPFLIYCNDEIAGFAMVDKKGSDSSIDFNMAQFFILRKFKNKGIGRLAAQQLFDQFKGTWEVMVIPGNEGAYRFWKAVIKKYSGNHYSEFTKVIPHFNHSSKNIFKFNTKK